jgi:hypothetical protein
MAHVSGITEGRRADAGDGVPDGKRCIGCDASPAWPLMLVRPDAGVEESWIMAIRFLTRKAALDQVPLADVIPPGRKSFKLNDHQQIVEGIR